MALTYTGSTGVFTDVGKVVKNLNLFVTQQAAVAGKVDEILDAFQAGDLDVAVIGLPDYVATWETEYASRCSALQGYAQARLQDRTTVLLEVGSASSAIATVLARLIETMNADSETIDANACTSAATATAAGTNTGNASIITTKVLDGYSAPSASVAAHHQYKGLLTEVALAETHRFRCTTDSFEGGATLGAETWSWEANPSGGTWGTYEGSGTISTALGTVQAGTILSNGTFETFTTSNTPDDWDIDAGLAGTNIFEDADSADIYRGSKSLNLRGDGSTASISLSQTIASSVVANRRYVVCFRVKADASVSGDLTVTLAGTGYTAGTNTGDNRPSGLGLSQTDESIVIVSASLPTSWTLAWFFVNIPDTIPSDLELTITLDDTPASAKNVWIDDLFMAPVTWGGGIGVAVVPGATGSAKEDNYTVATTNDAAGTFQEFFRRAFGVQLPSDSGGTETIADTLAA